MPNTQEGPLSDLTEDKLAYSASLTPEQIGDILRAKPDHYGSFPLPKRDGTFRTIRPPKKVLKHLQEAIYHLLRRRIVFADCVHGGIKNKDIQTNARPHVGKTYVLNIDIEKFFPATKYDRIEKSLAQLGAAPRLAALLADICTLDGELPQGSPASVILGNIALRDLDSKISHRCKKNRFSYTRYVDDITISGNETLRDSKKHFVELVSSTGYRVHPDKIHLAHKSQRQTVTGLVVNEKLRPAPAYIEELVAQIKLAILPEFGIETLAALHGMQTSEIQRSIWGRIQHIQRFDENEGTRLRQLYRSISRF